MEQNYSKKKKLIKRPRPIVIKRILAFSKYFEQNKKEYKYSDKKD
tara:strand:- start:2304 stop:2438 length:135 start_codon:yes stop_codon:yes gene_type:complete